MNNDQMTSEQLDTTTGSDASEGTFEVREEEHPKFAVSEFDRAPLTDVNFGF